MKTVLAVDDKEENLYYLRVLLEGCGYRVVTARNGAEALASATAAAPDLVISDLLMPAMDGYTLLRRWRQDERLKRVPFVVYTATYTDPEDEKLALGLGADAFIVKPVEPQELLARIDDVLAHAERSLPAEPPADEQVVLERYNDSLVRKLEKKMIELEGANRELQRRIAERDDLAETQRAILEALPADVALLDPQGRIIAANGSWRRLGSAGGLRSPAGIGTDYLALCRAAEGEFAPAVADGIARVLSGTAAEFSIDFPCETGSELRWYRLTAVPFRDALTTRAVVMHIDITGRRKREAQLAQQAALLDNAKDAIIVRGLDHHIFYWNRAAELLYGWRREDLVGREGSIVIPPAELPALQVAEAEVVARGRWAGRLDKTAKDGRQIVVDSNWTLVRGDNGTAAAIFIIDTDITDRLKLEERLVQAQKLEAIGQLTGGVAHDFNNLLGVISGNLEFLGERMPDRPDLREMLHDALAATERGAALTNSLLAFSRRQPLEPAAIDPNVLLQGMMALLRRTVRENIELIFQAASTWFCEIDPGQLQNAVLNLIVNAQDAMPRGGRLIVETADTALDGDYAEANIEVTAGDYVMIAVTDTGSGMTPVVAARAFEPFFTTKGLGKGTGLGLSMVYGFVRQSLGHVKIYSEVGHGTTIRLYLPRSAAAAQPVLAFPPADIAAGDGETVLVVEDDESMRKLTTGMLKSLGYKLVAADNADAALHELGARPDIALLLTDVVLAGAMNGHLLAERALRERPGLKVLFMSGYTEIAIRSGAGEDQALHLLQKPFTRRRLAAKLRQVLEQEETT